MDIKEIKKDIQKYEARIENPGEFTPAQIALYKRTLSTARTRLAEAEARNPGTARRATMEPRSQPVGQGSSATRQRTQQGQTENTHMQFSTPSTDVWTEMRTLIVNLPGTGTPEVQIQWSDKDPETVTEGTALSRFKSCLRDLAESKLYQEERFSQLPNYTGWHRAIGYYQALTQFWQRPPSAEEINLSRAAAYRHLFGLIIKEATQ